MWKIKSMAVLHKKEEKIQAVLGRLNKKYTDEQFVEMFIKLYSKDWGKIKSAYIKQSQDKEPGSVINMPKPEIYLKQVLSNYLQNALSTKTEEVVAETPVVEAKAVKTPAKKKAEETVEAKKTKTTEKKKVVEADETIVEKKPKAAPKKKTVVAVEEASAEVKKTKAAPKKPAAKK